jgi:Domain of unknown function (DUF4260)
VEGARRVRPRRLAVERLPKQLLHAEGAAVFVAATVLYFDGDHTWWLYPLLVLAPDLTFVAYAAGPRIGALAYDLAHTYVLPVALGTVGILAEENGLVGLALIWAAHIGADRLLGYGLKYPTRFRDTHLQRV